MKTPVDKLWEVLFYLVVRCADSNCCIAYSGPSFTLFMGGAQYLYALNTIVSLVLVIVFLISL